jgi:hypothetical protein
LTYGLSGPVYYLLRHRQRSRRRRLGLSDPEGKAQEGKPPAE